MVSLTPPIDQTRDALRRHASFIPKILNHGLTGLSNLFDHCRGLHGFVLRAAARGPDHPAQHKAREEKCSVNLSRRRRILGQPGIH
jgi:hypothetical protein